MRKNRTILWALLIPLLLDLLVFFTSAPTRGWSESTCFKQRSDQAIEICREIEEEFEGDEEDEFLRVVLPKGSVHVYLLKERSSRVLLPPSESVAPQPFGWFMPLLI